jgi:hypothetical protein
MAKVIQLRRIGSGPVSGLDWDGTGLCTSASRAFYFATPPAQVPLTVIWRVYQRNQVAVGVHGTRYYANFFWGNDGDFNYGAGYGEAYYGAHPYPEGAGNPGTRDGTGDGKWEISAHANDYTQRDDGTSPFPTYEAWYQQAFRIQNTGGNVHELKYWVNLPSVTTFNTITQSIDAARTTPPSPIFIVGNAPNNDAGTVSWGGYVSEEQNAILRGLQIYTSALTEAQITALAALETDAAAASYCTDNSITSVWYRNMNPTVADITDKSGAGHNPAWYGSGRPDDWTG